MKKIEKTYTRVLVIEKLNQLIDAFNEHQAQHDNLNTANSPQLESSDKLCKHKCICPKCGSKNSLFICSRGQVNCSVCADYIKPAYPICPLCGKHSVAVAHMTSNDRRSLYCTNASCEYDVSFEELTTPIPPQPPADTSKAEKIAEWLYENDFLKGGIVQFVAYSKDFAEFLENLEEER